jgi:DNA-binding XRE family transcriptional regulator
VGETVLILERLKDGWRIDMPLAPQKTKIAIAFGQVITRLRKERGWTILMLAKRSGLNAKHLSVIEQGGNVPGIYTLFTLGDVFGRRVSEIVAEVEYRVVASA